MPDYKLSKIYKIEVLGHGLFVGNTAQKKLSSRRAGHVRDSVRVPDFIPLYTAINSRPRKWDEIKIILLESFPCNTHDELEARTQFWIDQLKPNLNPGYVSPEAKVHLKRKANTTDYSKWGKMYKIVIGKDMYIGSTGRRLLTMRRTRHLGDSKLRERAHYPLYKLINSLPEKWNGIALELLEEFPCSSAAELHAREGFWIKNLKPSLNRTVAGRGTKEYLEDHADRIKQYRKDRYEKNKEKAAKQHQIRAKIQKECPHCGVLTSQYHLRRHVQTVHRDLNASTVQ
jgi:hypothetical protein